MWFFIIKAIAGSVIGSATESWFRDTKLGVWFYAKMDSLYSWAAKRYGIKVITDEQKQMAKFPELAKRLDSIETRLRLLERDDYHKQRESNYQDSF
jgi:hypothetical protein